MSEHIVLQGDQAYLRGGDGAPVQVDLAKFIGQITRATVTGFDNESLAHSVRWQVSAGPLVVCIVELEPELRWVRWLAEDSPAPWGEAATYRERRLATPFMLLKVPFLKGRIIGRVELFYRNEPARYLSDELYWCNLYNVSPNAHGCTAWFCTQHLKPPRGASITDNLHETVNHLLGGGFNASSDAHEGQSAFAKAKTDGVDPRVTDVNRWEAESVRDPRFVLGVAWKPVGMTIRQLIEAELKQHGVLRDLGSTTELASLLVASRNGRKGT